MYNKLSKRKKNPKERKKERKTMEYEKPAKRLRLSSNLCTCSSSSYFPPPPPPPPSFCQVIKKVRFLDHEIEITPEEEKLYNTAKEERGVLQFEKMAEFLRQCRKDWDHLKLSSRVFLINRMINNNDETSKYYKLEDGDLISPCICMYGKTWPSLL